MYGSGGAEIRWAVNSQLANKIEVSASTPGDKNVSVMKTLVLLGTRGAVTLHFSFFSMPPMRHSIAALATAKSTPMPAAPVADIPQGVLESMVTNMMAR